MIMVLHFDLTTTTKSSERHDWNLNGISWLVEQVSSTPWLYHCGQAPCSIEEPSETRRYLPSERSSFGIMGALDSTRLEFESSERRELICVNTCNYHCTQPSPPSLPPSGPSPVSLPSPRRPPPQKKTS